MNHLWKYPRYLSKSSFSALFLYLFIHNIGYGQSVKTLYYDKSGSEVDKSEAYYSASGTMPNGKNYFIGKVTEKFLSNSKTKARKTFDETGQQTGIGVEYYENGQVKEKYQLKNGHVYGGYVLWYPNGVKALEREYTGYSTATGINHRTYNAWDSLGNPIVTDGMGTLEEYYDDFSVSAKGKIFKGLRSGIWKGYYPNGNHFYTEKFKSGELKSGTSITLDSTKFNYTQINTLPSPKIGFPKYYEKLTKEMNYPKSAKKIKLQGTVHIAYTIDKYGEVVDYYIFKSLSPDCDQEAIRIFEETTVEWNPGTSRGNPQSFVLSLPVSFKL